ncbi:hypothetical protein P8629_03135 [Hydrogenovibrio sp. 3SP14C1]|uniref:ubiquinone biosynthesis accessory factor UbiJ n=1 Tax=Hydrogenovibrio sp. 3SP14C1 TaxID=3038774 RepID=UPI00241802AD|nr:hypothetical protein [Hydrogenovibrio sp. 3SP14C1]MDG4811993.1 hypothetical protein [Hydrogenovibrio sp. 3SP14C1]
MDTSENSPGLVNTSLSKLFETLLNQAIQLDDQQGQAFAACDEKVIQLTLTDFAQTFFLIYQIQPDGHGIFSVQNHLMGSPDCHLKFSCNDWIQNQPAYNISGDETVAEAFIEAVKTLEIDWEEQLSKVTGDLIAFKVGSTVRQGQKTSREAKQKIGETLKEYLQFEIEVLPTHSQINRFAHNVQQTTQAVDQLAERIQRLQNTSST